MASSFKSVNLKEAGKSILFAFVAAVAISIYSAFNDGVDWPTRAEFLEALRTGISSALGYIVITYFTNSNGEVAKKEQ